MGNVSHFVLRPFGPSLVPLLHPHNESGYHCVYRHHGGKWRARVLDTRDRGEWRNPNCDNVLDTHGPGPTDLGVFDGPKEAARAVAAWYLAQYGDRWPEAFASRKGKPWCVRWSARLGGYRVEVWVRGVKRDLTYGDCAEPGSLPNLRYLWPSRAAAREAVRNFIRWHKPPDVLPRVWLWRSCHQAPGRAAMLTG